MEKKEIKYTDELVIPVMERFRIPRDEAERRLHLLGESNIMQSGHPDDPETQRLIDGFLAQDSETTAQLVLFDITLTSCIENAEFVKNYDRLHPKAHMAYALKQIEGGKMNKTEEREANRQFKKFSEFVREFVFSRVEQDIDARS